MFLFDTVWKKCGGLRIKFPEPIVIKELHPKKDAREGAKKVLSSCLTNLLHLH
jgi:hypothetical protein